MALIEGIEYGPLSLLIGNWFGDNGLDIAPEEDGEERNDFYENISFVPIGEVTNADEQELIVLRYHKQVFEKKNDELSHDQVGYYSWDKKNDYIIASVTIPRGASVLALGSFEGNSCELKAQENSIIQSDFLTKKAKTTCYKINLEVSENTFSYTETIFLDIYGRKFEHKETNTLVKKD